jgi:hypothetical protein
MMLMGETEEDEGKIKEQQRVMISEQHLYMSQTHRNSTASLMCFYAGSSNKFPAH